MSVAEPWQLRRCILGSIPESLFEVRVESRYIFVPESHIRALDPNRALVVGGRGTGKTFWWETLASEIGAHILSAWFDPRKEDLQYQVSIGHGAKALDAGRPLDADTLKGLFEKFPGRVVWKSVLLARVAPERFEAIGSWGAWVAWVHANAEQAGRTLAETDERLFQSKQRHLVVFDAIDRTGELWQDVVRAHRGLFGLLLDLSGMRAIRAKAFVRSDILEDPEVMRFPDASKLQTTAVELAWKRSDLYGLLWQYLGNSDEFADTFRALSGDWSQFQGIWVMPRALRSQEDAQERLWHRLAGQWMGASERRGDTYPWLTNHLGDAFGRVSPRSFLAAVRAAALATPDDAPHAIHHRAIQDGVRGAAAIRAREIQEDFPWTKQALQGLSELLVPCDESAALEAWQHVRLDESLDRYPEARRRRRHGGDLRSVIDDLVDLGVVQKLRDGRLNVPDVYRLGFGLKRKGGVAPKRS